jgi:hypothetical protein
MRFYIILLINLLSITAFCQGKNQVDIQYIDLSDSVVIKEIKSIINEEINSNDPEHLFQRGFGYITINIKEFSKSDTLYSYYISPSLSDIKKSELDKKHPIFYTYVANRLVIIYLDILRYPIFNSTVSSRSKSKLIKKINAFLEKPVDRTFYDSSNKIVFRDKHFRLNRFKFDSGKYIFIMKNSAYKIRNENNFK